MIEYERRECLQRLRFDSDAFLRRLVVIASANVTDFISGMIEPTLSSFRHCRSCRAVYRH